MPGPSGKPTLLKALQGNPGKRKLNKREPSPAKQPAVKPAWIQRLAEEQWDIYWPIVSAWGFGTETDRMALEALCVSYAEWRLNTQYCFTHGYSFERGDYQCLRPEAKQAETAFRRMMASLDRFGLNPSARSKIQLPAPTEEDSTANELFGT